MHLPLGLRALTFAAVAALLVLPAPAAAIRDDATHLVANRQQKKSSARARKLAAVRADLHRNLDSKGNGFIRSWHFDAKVFTLTVDKRRYQQNMLYAATMTARAIFDTNGVPLPKLLVIRDVSGEVLGEGAFANVPKLVDSIKIGGDGNAKWFHFSLQSQYCSC
jgi:hypothetical protein